LGLTDFAQTFIWAAVWLVGCWHAAVESAQGHIARAIVAHSFGTIILALFYWHFSYWHSSTAFPVILLSGPLPIASDRLCGACRKDIFP
jgi:hypothetical protein